MLRLRATRDAVAPAGAVIPRLQRCFRRPPARGGPPSATVRALHGLGGSAARRCGGGAVAAVGRLVAGGALALRARRLARGARLRGGEEAPLHRLFYINLDRRPERRVRFERRAQALGLDGVASRFPAVDGRSIDFDRYPRSAVTEGGIRRARSPPAVVNGVELTPGALGLILSYHTILKRIAADDDDQHVYVIAEDDAVLAEDFCQRLDEALGVLARERPGWDFLHIGYYDDDCTVRSLEGPAGTVFSVPLQIFGLFGAAVRPPGARSLLRHLFPLDEQIDSALARVYDRIDALALRSPLMTATHSTSDNSDIQLLPPGFRFGG